MEKRTFLAIILSMMVLLVWGRFVAPQPKTSPQTEFSQYVENKEVVVEKDVSKPLKSEVLAPAQPSPAADIKEATTKLTTEKIQAEFSNLGGSLKSLSLTAYDYTFPLTGIFDLEGYEKMAFQLIGSDEDSVAYQHSGDEVRITKIYSIGDDERVINAEIQIENVGKMSKVIDVDVTAYKLKTYSLDNKEMARERSLLEYSVSTEGDLLRKTDAYKFSPKESKEERALTNWVGFRNRYYFFIAKPHFKADGFEINQIDKNELTIGLNSNKIKIQPGSNVVFDSSIIAGPQDLKLLKSYDQGFDKIMVFSRFALLDAISKIIYAFLFFVHGIFPNWGICIILVSLIIYGATYPLTARGMANMRKMQSLQPEMSVLREKYKNNPQKLNQEMAGFWKKHKINPFGGCVFMLMQLPIFIGLYQVLWRSVVFKGAGFLWIKDLSMPDRLMIMPFSLPYIGNEFNILPIIMSIAMFVQQKITSKNMVTTDPAQIAQQKMMSTVLPVFLGFIFYKFASGLALYFTMFYILSIFTQIRMAKKVQVV